jgi:hypothetical protein
MLQPPLQYTLREIASTGPHMYRTPWDITKKKRLASQSCDCQTEKKNQWRHGCSYMTTTKLLMSHFRISGGCSIGQKWIKHLGNP